MQRGAGVRRATMLQVGEGSASSAEIEASLSIVFGNLRTVGFHFSVEDV